MHAISFVKNFSGFKPSVFAMACNHICSGCNNPVSASCGIACDLCKQFSHFNCLGIKQEEISTINRLHLHSPHLKILCVICIDVFNTPPLSPSEASPLNAENPFLKYVHTIVSHELKPIRHQLESLQHSINTTSHPINENLSYANKLKNASECSVIIKPKNSSQTVKQTKSDVLHSIKPLSSDIEISSVKSVSNGGLVIKCANKLHSEKLLDIASNKLPDTYNIKKTPLILPRLRFVGIPEGLDKNDIATYALTQNPHLFHKDSICEVKKIWSTSKSENTLQAECLVDADSYKKLLDTGHLLIGLNGCTVYDAVTVLRCFKCNAFNHGSSQCKKNPVCPVCSESHVLKDCLVNKDKTKFSCLNCSHLRNSQHLDIDTSHAVWDYNRCFAYKLALAKLKQDVFNIPISLATPKTLMEPLPPSSSSSS